ncbi:MAG: quinolinate synthase NadA [Candidatus Brocadiia bacterium]
MNMAIVEKINHLRRERDAVILAHYYQRAEIQDLADFVGDSLALSRTAAGTRAKVIVFCGVDFMAETAAILCPDRIVLHPDPSSGCPMADMCSARELRELKARVPDAKVICYVNSSAEVKAESDICCTSSNAAAIMARFGNDVPLIFVPDRWLGEYTARKAGRTNLRWANASGGDMKEEGSGAPVYLWSGYCPTHHHILPEFVERMKAEHPSAMVAVHPECRREITAMADFVGSTAQILEYCQASPATEFIIGTEIGILHPLRVANPGKTFYIATPIAECPNMKLITLEKLLWALEDCAPRVIVEPKLAAAARIPISRMLQRI